MTIFIKTWFNDLEWLTYCLCSIRKYAPQYKVVIVADDNCKKVIDSWNLTKEKVYYVRPTMDGYIYQQWIKLKAFEFVDTEWVMFLDSDCILTETLEFDGVSTILYTPYDKVGDAICWKAITESVLGHEVEYEFMRRNELIYASKDIEKLWKAYDFKDIFSKVKGRNFSEFNVMGAYMFYHNDINYNFVNTEVEIPKGAVLQKWSWGGLTKEIKKELEDYL